MIIQLQEKLTHHLAYLEQDKTNPNLLLTVGMLKAQILHHQEKLDDAITLLEQLILEHKSSADIAGLLALLHVDNNNPIKADLFSKKALALNPSNYEGRLVQMLLRASLNDATLDEINALIEINPQDARLWFALGNTQMRHMNLTAAEQAFSKTTDIFPNFYESWIGSGWCHLLQNNISKAEMAYLQAVKIDVDAADGWGGLALIDALQNNMAEAKEKLQKAELLDPQSFLVAVTRIIVANQSKPEEAGRQFNLAFPSVAAKINQVLAQAMLAVSTAEKTIH